ncbi:hypothetical protein OEV98_14060 [Caldibacillus lycopersici]|uniref:Uncharacterized protein n=1 Tax=Perspicuibacillus lycopersici TaxID=1325689 RepID=A0AAE3LRH5_9BACI|nr:hypothetical protein [Perspicuibacillus lycopersici]MCU9614664.1 hypothetical protein [Perspicuibacillus lycopersici]
MIREYDARHIFLTIGIICLLISPILLIFLPTSLANIFYQTDTVWLVFIPDGNYYVYGFGCVLIAFAFIVIAIINKKMWSISISILSFLCGVFVLYLASHAYETIGNDGISMREAFSMKEYHYGWEDIAQAKRHIGYNDDNYYGFEIIFNDGNKMMIDDDNQYSRIRGVFTNKLEYYDIEVEFQKKRVVENEK